MDFLFTDDSLATLLGTGEELGAVWGGGRLMVSTVTCEILSVVKRNKTTTGIARTRAVASAELPLEGDEGMHKELERVKKEV